MTQYDNTNRGVLFTNDRKERDTHPDEKGSATLLCPHCAKTFEVWASGWHKTSAKGPLTSLSFTPKEQPPARPAAQPDPTPRRPNGRPAPSYADLDDDIPF
jgi:hypothetical protein